MTSARVEHVLEEIAGLTPAEKQELVRALPRVVGVGDVSDRRAALRQAIATRERIMARLEAEGRRPGSIVDDLDEVRDGRLAALGRVPNGGDNCDEDGAL